MGVVKKLLPLLLLTACVEQQPEEPQIDDGRCFVTVDKHRVVPEVRVDAACSPGETRSLVLTVSDGDSVLTSSMIRFPCDAVRFITQVTAPNADLRVEGLLVRDDGTRVACN